MDKRIGKLSDDLEKSKLECESLSKDLGSSKDRYLKRRRKTILTLPHRHACREADLELKLTQLAEYTRQVAAEYADTIQGKDDALTLLEDKVSSSLMKAYRITLHYFLTAYNVMQIKALSQHSSDQEAEAEAMRARIRNREEEIEDLRQRARVAEQEAATTRERALNDVETMAADHQRDLAGLKHEAREHAEERDAWKGQAELLSKQVIYNFL